MNSVGDDASMRHDRLRFVESWWKKTKNPLYAWEAIFLCLCAEPREPIPEWCLPYLAQTAQNLTRLAWDSSRPKGDLQRRSACKLVPKALGLVSQGAKSAFAKTADDGIVMRAALDTDRGGQETDRLATKRNISKERATRIIKRGAKLISLR
jgi:hypothetical protein